MHTGSMMPPRDGNGSDEELLAKVIPLRRRGDIAHDPGCSTLQPLGAEAEPWDSEKIGPQDGSTVALERSIWDPPTVELPRRPTAAQRRLRRVPGAHVLRWRGLPAEAIATTTTGAIALAALVLALSVFERGGSPQQGSALHASVIGGSHVKDSKAHATTVRRPATTAGAHRHQGAGAQHRPASSIRASKAAQSTRVSTGDSAGTAVVSSEGSGSSAVSSSPPGVTTVTEERSTTEAPTSPSATYTPVASVQPPPARRKPSREGAEVKEAGSEFGFER